MQRISGLYLTRINMSSNVLVLSAESYDAMVNGTLFGYNIARKIMYADVVLVNNIKKHNRFRVYKTRYDLRYDKGCDTLVERINSELGTESCSLTRNIIEYPVVRFDSSDMTILALKGVV